MGKNTVQVPMTNGKMVIQITHWTQILIVLHKKITKLNYKKNINIVVKLLQENNITPKAISISLR